VWSLYDGQDVLHEVNPRFAENICTHVQRVIERDPFHVSANTDPKGDRSKRPQEVRNAAGLSERVTGRTR
jgi:4-hydroxyphenylacetate 3-monooxygenase